ncbi:MAG: hypothetical protein GX791_01380 [Synergistaceae bacterium]|nr:hypothetical protein [Synergistaceae bacterium]
MEPLATPPGKREDIVSFREALREEHERKIARLERERNGSLDELIGERRAQVELRVKEMRREHEQRFSLLLEEKRKEGIASVRTSLLQHFDSLNRLCGDKMKEKILALRKNRTAEYATFLLFLAREGLEAADLPAVISVEPGEAVLLSTSGDSPLGEGVEIVEEPREQWGGCRITSGTTVIDNTLSSRWNKLSGEFALELSRLLNDTFSEINDKISKL